MALLALIIYTRVRVVRPFVCANCVRVYTIERAYVRAYMLMHLYPREFAFVYTQKRKRSFLRAYRACLRADLIKMQNAFARKIFQHSNHFGFRNFQHVLYIGSSRSSSVTITELP